MLPLACYCIKAKTFLKTIMWIKVNSSLCRKSLVHWTMHYLPVLPLLQNTVRKNSIVLYLIVNEFGILFFAISRKHSEKIIGFKSKYDFFTSF